MLFPGQGQSLTVPLGEGLFTIPTIRQSVSYSSADNTGVPLKKIYSHSGVSNPTDIIHFKGRFIATELFNNRLAIFDDFTFKSLDFFDPGSIGERFVNPHFLAITQKNTLLITNGWDNSIIEINDVKGTGWREFNGVETFNAPHGICVDEAGWIYVADSLNSRPRTNITGAYPLDGRLSWAEWAGSNRLMSSCPGGFREMVEQNYLPALGFPYGIIYDSPWAKIVVCYIGDLHNPEPVRGGFMTLEVHG